jgi:hypothetical protein
LARPVSVAPEGVTIHGGAGRQRKNSRAPCTTAALTAMTTSQISNDLRGRTSFLSNRTRIISDHD